MTTKEKKLLLGMAAGGILMMSGIFILDRASKRFQEEIWRQEQEVFETETETEETETETEETETETEETESKSESERVRNQYDEFIRRTA